MALIYPLTCSEAMDLIRDASFDTLCCEFSVMQHGNGGKAPLMYILTLAESKQIIALKLCILVYYATRGKEIPKELQLRAAIASIERNSLVVATTGFGKTHIMALLILLEKSMSNKIFITISPLKRLQVTQVCLCTIIYSWGLLTVVII